MASSPKALLAAELGPIQNFCAPDVSGVQNLKPVLGGVLLETLRDNPLNFVATSESLDGVEISWKAGRSSSLPSVGRWVIARAR